MKRKLYWGLAILITGLIGVSIVMLTRTTDTEPKIIYKDVEPTARPGYKLVPHNDHYHEIPIDSDKQTDEVPNDVQSESTTSAVPTNTPPPMSNNPVKDLREYLQKKGHWSAKWIPEFPPEDKEAARLAHYYLIMLKHEAAGNEYYDGPALIPEQETFKSLQHYKDMNTQRSFDIYKLSWSVLEYPPGNPETFKFRGRK